MCHKGVDGRLVTTPEESAARIPSLTENNAMFFMGLRSAITRFHLSMCGKRRKCSRGQARAPWHAIARQLRLPNNITAKKMTSRET